MILDGIIRLATAALTAIIGLLPAASESLGLGSPGDWTSEIASAAGPVDRLIPLHEAVSLMVFCLFVLLPPLLVFKLATWVWAHVPFLGKG